MDALELVDELRRERSLTVLSAVHDLTLAGQFADRLLLLDQRPRGRERAARRRAARGRAAGATSAPGIQVLTTAHGDRAVISLRPERNARPGTG